MPSSFQENGFVIARLPAQMDSALQRVYNDLQKVSATSWTQVIKYDAEITDISLLSPSLAEERQKARSRLDSGELCYSFKRIKCDGVNLDLAAIQQLKTFLLSDQIISFVKEKTGRTVGAISLFYVNQFGDGDFLTTHRDTGENLALVISLTRDWNPNNGGITFLLDNENQVRHALNPAFGQALILDCVTNTVPHFVSAVASTTNKTRMAIVARYS